MQLVVAVTFEWASRRLRMPCTTHERKQSRPLGAVHRQNKRNFNLESWVNWDNFISEFICVVFDVCMFDVFETGVEVRDCLQLTCVPSS